MREIKFRGKRIDNGKWVYGTYYEHLPPLQAFTAKGQEVEKSKYYIANTAFADWNMPRQVEFIEVDVSTLGQFTGLKDKNNNEIYEADIIKYSNSEEEGVGEIAWSPAHMTWRIMFDNDPSLLYYFQCSSELEVIGNIFENQDLLDSRNKLC